MWADYTESVQIVRKKVWRLISFETRGLLSTDAVGVMDVSSPQGIDVL